MAKQITAIIVGAGHRALLYSTYALENPQALKIVGVADPTPSAAEKRRRCTGLERICALKAPRRWRAPQAGRCRHQRHHGYPACKNPSRCCAGATTCFWKSPSPSMRTRCGAAARRRRDRPQGDDLPRTALRAVLCGRSERLLAGEIGDIINIQATEHVSYHHLAVSYIRGKWGNEEKCGAPMLLAKCCHDIDLIMWLKSGVAPRQVASFWQRLSVRPGQEARRRGQAVPGGLRHRGKLPVLGQKALHRPSDRWSFYVWDCLEHLESPPSRTKIQSLKTDNIHGRCVWTASTQWWTTSRWPSISRTAQQPR